jgi:hypothetical protein
MFKQIVCSQNPLIFPLWEDLLLRISPLGLRSRPFHRGTSPLQALTNKTAGAGGQWLLPANQLSRER